jgi:D-sedoheptulose 7-phosphate isomerase
MKWKRMKPQPGKPKTVEESDAMFTTVLHRHMECLRTLEKEAAGIEQIGALLSAAIAKGRKILICGNGGSAADAQHFAAELVGRFERERSAWPAIALTTDTSILTAIGNDYGFAEVFARQVRGLGQKEDVFIGISTSGNSENVIQAVTAAKEAGMQTIGLLGHDGGALKSQTDHAIVVRDPKTARIQEAHILILHYWAMLIEEQMNLVVQ